MGNNGGRPPVFADADELMNAVDEYFIYIEGEQQTITSTVTDSSGKEKEVKETQWVRLPEPATITGLVLYLGFANRQSLLDYEKHEEYSDVIKRAKTRVEHEYEKKLSGDKPTGSIFALKNFGWKDKTELEHTAPQGISITYNNQAGNNPLPDED